MGARFSSRSTNSNHECHYVLNELIARKTLQSMIKKFQNNESISLFIPSEMIACILKYLKSPIHKITPIPNPNYPPVIKCLFMGKTISNK